MKKYGGGGNLKAKHYIFVGGGRGGGRAFFLQSSGQLAFVKMHNVLQVVVFLKNAVCSNGICSNEKIVLEEGSPEKMSYASAMVVVFTDKLIL